MLTIFLAFILGFLIAAVLIKYNSNTNEKTPETVKPITKTHINNSEKEWLRKFNIPKGHYLVSSTDMDIGVIMGGNYSDPPVVIKETFDDVKKYIESLDDKEIRVEVYDSNYDLIYTRYEQLK